MGTTFRKWEFRHIFAAPGRVPIEPPS